MQQTMIVRLALAHSVKIKQYYDSMQQTMIVEYIYLNFKNIRLIKIY